MALTPQQFEDKLKQSPNEFAKIFNNAPFVAIIDVEGAIKQRIFNKGIASDETQIGQYDDKKKQTFLTGLAKPSLTKAQASRLSTLQKKGKGELTYKELRELKGLQTAYVDLEFTGDLRKSIITGKRDDKATVEINNTKEGQIAAFLTTKYKKPIFAPSEKEIAEAKELMLNYIKEGVSEVIKTWR